MHRVIDFQDDLGAAFIAAGEAPLDMNFFKEASAPEAYEMNERDFALVIVDDANRLHRKFACHDKGNTVMSLWYLENVPSGLPEKATKVAAAVLYQAAQDFGLTDDILASMFPKTATQAAKMGQKIEQGKLASAPGGTPDPMDDGPDAVHAGKPLRHWANQDKVPGDVVANILSGHADDPKSWVNDPTKKYVWSAAGLGRKLHPNWAAAHAAHWDAKTASAPAHMLDRRVRVKDTELTPLRTYGHRKEANALAGAGLGALIGAGIGAATAHPDRGESRGRRAAVGGVIGAAGGYSLGANLAEDQALRDTIDRVTNSPGPGPGWRPPGGVPAEEHQANLARFRAALDAARAEALGGPPKTAAVPAHMLDRRVRVKDTDLAPLPAAGHRKEADFDKVASAVREWSVLDPYGRRVRALELEKISSVVEIPANIKAYMGHEVGPNLKVAMDARAERIARTAESADDYRRVAAMAKIGSIDTEDAVEAIHLLDQANGIRIPEGYGPRVPDPYVCVYGLHKQAMWSWSQGAEYVNEHDLDMFASSPDSKHTLGQLFEDTLVEKFRRDPVKTFQNMPREQQHVVARAASQSGYTNTGGLGT